MSRILPQNWNDVLALILIFIIPALWILHGMAIITIGEAVVGALIITWGNITQYYFRRAPPVKEEK